MPRNLMMKNNDDYDHDDVDHDDHDHDATHDFVDEESLTSL